MTNTAINTFKDTPPTPMLAQYHKIKEQHPGCLLFFRLGDFYELFYEDAVQASSVLEIALTRRGKTDGQDIPMCGVPHHASESYVARLIKAGYKVAICEQLEAPETAKKRDGYKAVVRRDVIRIITPGTLTEDTLLSSRQHNFLVAFAAQKDQLGIGAIDISTGEFFLESPDPKSLKSAITKLSPSEILLPQNLYNDPKVLNMLEDWKTILTPQPNSRFDKENSKRRLEETFQVKTLEGLGSFKAAEIMAGGALLEYVHLTQKGRMPRVLPPVKRHESHVLYIDAATQRNLELIHTLSGQKKGSLLDTIDRTVTAGGARLMYRNLLEPLQDISMIHDRLDQVEWFQNHNDTRDALRDHLKSMPDLERLLGRITVGRSGPRDLGAVRAFLEGSQQIKELFYSLKDALPLGLQKHIDHLNFPQNLLDTLQQGLQDVLPVNARDGNFIASGYSHSLDDLIQFRDQGREMILKLQTQYSQETGIPTLKIKYNNVIGYHIDITPSYKGRLPEDRFIHRQTLMGSMRYVTNELLQVQEKILNAGSEALSLELLLFQEFIEKVIENNEQLGRLVRHVAHLDFISSLGELARTQHYIRPQVNDTQVLNIVGGRHPVVENALSGNQTTFSPNDCRLDEGQQLLLITGPNMAGKSTYLRQNALIIILAQMGSFVPATSAEIGLVDRIFSRVGASDDLAKGHSTFMVEMVETATILNQATKKSFVILDEIGRGTSTFDGLSLAWSVVEHLHNIIECRSLFATHYHELTVLKGTLAKLACYTIKIQEWNGEVIFLHQVIPGTADKSYGIHVAKLAGLPPSVLKRAESILKELESQKSTFIKKQPELPLMATPKALSAPNQNHQKIVEALKNITPDQLTPKEALDFLYGIKEKMTEDDSPKI